MDETEELAALAAEIAQAEGLAPEEAMQRAVALLPWLEPYAAQWSATVLCRIAERAGPAALEAPAP